MSSSSSSVSTSPLRIDDATLRFDDSGKFNNETGLMGITYACFGTIRSSANA